MGTTEEETNKRLRIAKIVADDYRDISRGIVLVGSTAYGTNHSVRETSDVDLLVITDNLKGALEALEVPNDVKDALKNRYFEGYCTKHDREGVPISTHLLSSDALDIIGKCFVADLRVYRPAAKEETYKIYGFERNEYPYRIKNISLPDVAGVRTIVPVSFIHNDRYHLGVHRDKLLSNPNVLHDPDGVVAAAIDKTWSVVAENLIDESRRRYGSIDLGRMNIMNCLAKKDRFSEESRRAVEERSAQHLARLLR